MLQILKLPQSSLAELARNSVIQSGFEMEIKRHWLGQEWYLPGAEGNDINKVSLSDCKFLCVDATVTQTNVPNIRLAYRHRTLVEELSMIRTRNAIHSPESHPAVLLTADNIAAQAMVKRA